MATPVISTAFVSGEVSPALYGHVDLVRLKVAAATMRNLFVRVTGGANSRAGTSFVGYSKQTGRAYPPRLIAFEYNISQGLALEIGNYYMRPIYQGAFVGEPPLSLSGATQAKPCQITVAGASATGATFDASGSPVVSSYAPGDFVTLAGGVASRPATLLVQTTQLVSVNVLFGVGVGYVPGDYVILSGGAATTPAQVTVETTGVSSATVDAGGSGGTNGVAIVSGTTGTGTVFQAEVTIASGAIVAVNAILLPGLYTVNPTTLGAEPVTGAGLSGAKLALAMAPSTVTISNPGVYTANPSSGSMTQAGTGGSGSGAQFNLAIFAPLSLAVSDPGSYSAFPANPVAQASTTGTGIGAEFNMSSASSGAYAIGDWLALSGVAGMTELNGRTVVVGAVSGDAYSLNDVFGNPIDSTGFSPYSGGGEASRYYTLSTPWGEADLPWLKVTQSADVMSICCVNQITGAEYQTIDLGRISDTQWQLSPLQMAPTIEPPGSCSVTATPQPSGSVAWASYGYRATAVNAADGSESIASPIGTLLDATDISYTQGVVTINLAGLPSNAQEYNFYKATPISGPTTQAVPPPGAGQTFGYVGSSFGPSFTDDNIAPDFAQVPPIHGNPFARGQIVNCAPAMPGSGYTYANVTTHSATGTGASIEAVVQNGQVVAYIVVDPGLAFEAGDTATVSGDGGGATCTLQIGAQSGTYPGVVAYEQQRRVYAYSLNNPDTYWMSQPGSFTNFDYRIPTIDSDAITGTPWSQQVNGVQWMIPMPGGLVVLTGQSAWQVTGQGGSSLNPQPITPSGQQAQPQAYNGVSPTVAPVKINFDILYVQAKGSKYRDLTYQFFTNIYTGTDLTVNSEHMFLGYNIVDHAWCEEPYKLLWSIRSDGVLLSMTFFKEQEIMGWARHDTNGLYCTCCSVVEPPVDALYLSTQRTINSQRAYMIERMDNRLWNEGVESTWCVDAGLSLAQPQPQATLQISSPNGVGSIAGIVPGSLIGGQNYSPLTTATVVDAMGAGPGAGSVATLTIAGGVVTGVALTGGAGYTAPQLVIEDAGGGFGASAVLELTTAATFAASAPVFSADDVGSVIRAFGGKATITGYTSPTLVSGTIVNPFLSGVQPNSGGAMQPATAGAWTKTIPISVVTGLYHLAGAYVTGLADGVVIPPTLVPANGEIALPQPSTAVTVGLGFQAQLQTTNLDAGAPTVQGQRKKVAKATIRVDNSRGIKVGSNQPNGSTLSPMQIAPQWSGLQMVPDLVEPAFGSTLVPLYTGDVRVSVSGGFGKPGQVAVQQDYPLPMNIDSIMPEVLEGDEAAQKAPPRRQAGQERAAA